MLAEGEMFRINAKKSVSLRVGDAGAVFVSVNNGEASPLGSAGQVVTRQFVVENKERETVQLAADGPRRVRTCELLSRSPLAAAPPAATTPAPTPTPVPLVPTRCGHAVEADARTCARTNAAA